MLAGLGDVLLLDLGFPVLDGVLPVNVFTKVCHNLSSRTDVEERRRMHAEQARRVNQVYQIDLNVGGQTKNF